MKPFPLVGVVSAILTALSLLIAVAIRAYSSRYPTGCNVAAYLLVGAWALITPVWFIVDWHTFKGDAAAFESFKYSQELARSVWIALVLVLAAITGIRWGH